MARPKKVAIIGAGPSGLVMAKTLLHNFPEGTFSPVIFEKRSKVGGLWSVDRPPASTTTSREHHATATTQYGGRGFVDPLMRTNLSRFSVAFSDLAWESVVNVEEPAGVPMFPRAWQVGKYLEKYVERYLSQYNVLRLEHEVESTERREATEPGGRWVVRWRNKSNDNQTTSDTEEGGRESARFDFLVVAAGHFGAPRIPTIEGFDEIADKTVHSSQLQSRGDVTHLLERGGDGKGKLVVIGGSMSGVEAASTLALHLSDLNSRRGHTGQDEKKFEVHHISSKPFWALPTYLPYKYPHGDSQTSSMPFLPLDLLLYDLARRGSQKGEEVKFGFGPVPTAQISKTNNYFRSLLGDDYRRIGGVGVGTDETGERPSPSWVTISNDYGEYVRSGAINVATGRVRAASSGSNSGLTNITLDTPEGQTATLDDVAAIVMATGFEPTQSLSFLPQPVLEILQYSENDDFLPIILDGKGISHAEIPDLGFVGFYRGAFWGPMEMQAQSLAKIWAEADLEHDIRFPTEIVSEKATERNLVHAFRNSDNVARGQFPMGDYVGLMESFARDLGISRKPMPAPAEEPGPVIPSRYGTGNRNFDDEISKTMNSLRWTILPDSGRPSWGTAAAVFRALHGRWKFSRQIRNGKDPQAQSVEILGNAIFYPRYPLCPDYEKEYVYEEAEEGAEPTKSVYGLSQDTSPVSNDAQIFVSPVDPSSSSNSTNCYPAFMHQLSVMLPQVGSDDERSRGGKYLVHAVDIRDPGLGNNSRGKYVFHLEGVSITKWVYTVTHEHVAKGIDSTDSRIEISETVYER